MPNLKWERPLTIAYWPTSKPLKALIKYLHSIFKMESRVRNHNLDKKLSTHFKALLSLILNVLIGILNSLKSFLNYYCKSWKTKVLLSPKLPSSVSLLSLEWLRFILLQKNCNLLRKDYHYLSKPNCAFWAIPRRRRLERFSCSFGKCSHDGAICTLGSGKEELRKQDGQ